MKGTGAEMIGSIQNISALTFFACGNREGFAGIIAA